MARVYDQRRASVDYGKRKAPKAQTPRTPWQRHMDRHRRVWKATRKHYRRHKHKRGAIAMWGGGIGLGVLTGMWVFQGTTSLLTGLVCVGAVGGGWVAHRYDDAKVMRGTRKTTEEDRARIRNAWAEPHRRREPATPEQPGTGKVRVESHRRDGDGVKAHYRSRPGQGEGEQPGGGWSAGDTKAEGKRRPTPSPPPSRPSGSGSNGTGRKPRRSAGKQGASGRVLHQDESPNSAEDGWKLREQGKCGECGDRGLWNSHGTPGTWRHTYCQACGK